MKKIKIAIKDSNDWIFELLEDGNKGDFFSLNEINEIDLSILKERINNLKDQEIREKIKSELEKFKEQQNKVQNALMSAKEKEWNLKKEQEFRETKILINSLEQKLSQQNEKLSREYENKNLNQKNDLTSKFQEEIKKLEISKARETEQLNQKLNNLKTNFESEKEKLNLIYRQQAAQIEGKLKLQLVEKETKLKDLERLQNQEIENKIEKIKLTYQNQNSLLSQEKTTYKELIIKLNEEISKLKREQGNIKEIGINLENWIETEFNNYFGMNPYISIVSQPKSKISAKKPDFLIIIKNENEVELERIVIEAKSESNTGENKRKNREFYPKLLEDSKNLNANWSILISELEKEKNFSIVKENAYRNFYLMRPQYFIPFLQIILELALKNEELREKEIKFQEKQDILRDFNDFKLKLFNSFDKIEKNKDEINKKIEKLRDIANDLENLNRKTYETHFYTLKNKIEKFSIEKKVIKKLEQF